ncbi:MAG: hypothetical protein WA484_03155 [Solirubrobacteraceae bacterium]
MPTIENSLLTLKGTGKRTAGALAILTLASVGLSACGGSSSGTASSANAAAKDASGASTSATGASGASSSTSASHPATPATAQSRFSSIRTCLQKNGVNLPAPTHGRSASGHSSGIPTATLQAALKKCYAGRTLGAFGKPTRPPASQATTGPVFRQALTKYAACLRQNGVNLPAPNTSGKGPIFSTKGINMSSPQFRAASMKCRATLIGAFRRSQRAASGASGAGTSPPAGGTAPGNTGSK